MRVWTRKAVLLVVGIIVVVVLLVLLVLAELYARFGLGLGDPPLWQADPEIEYLPLPSKRYRRFGKEISYNAYSMRSREFGRDKTDPAERRVLVLGDSIVHGGVFVDQKQLTTMLLEKTIIAARATRPLSKLL